MFGGFQKKNKKKETKNQKNQIKSSNTCAPTHNIIELAVIVTRSALRLDTHLLIFIAQFSLSSSCEFR
jgi:hypothetical protein